MTDVTFTTRTSSRRIQAGGTGFFSTLAAWLPDMELVPALAAAIVMVVCLTQVF